MVQMEQEDLLCGVFVNSFDGPELNIRVCSHRFRLKVRRIQGGPNSKPPLN